MTYRIETTCRKCKQIIPMSNSVIQLMTIEKLQIPLFASDCHIYPTATCDGSPSRVAKIESGEWRAAYDQLQQLAESTK